uniref:Uncharacterized protein n=1 Tax=Timema tahoe TaxID=61484 RepID=A0A7R9IJK8_9NEOP|nr:unnamed protein product [Timema tahoe]
MRLHLVSSLLTVAMVSHCCSADFFPTKEELLTQAKSFSEEELVAYYEQVFTLLDTKFINNVVRKILDDITRTYLPRIDPITFRDLNIQLDQLGANKTSPPTVNLSILNRNFYVIIQVAPYFVLTRLSWTRFQTRTASQRNFENSEDRTRDLLTGSFPIISINKFTQFLVDKLDVNLLMLKTDFGFLVPEIYTNGTYTLDGVIGVDLKGLNIRNGTIRLGLESRRLVIKEFTFDIAYDELTLQFDGLVGGGVAGRLINRLINELVDTIMRESKPYVVEAITSTVINNVNDLILGLTLRDILEWIRNLLPIYQEQHYLLYIAMKFLTMVLSLLVLATVDRCHSSSFQTSGQLLSYARSLTQERLLTYYEELAALTTHRASINDNLKALLEKLRASMGSPNEDLGIPALEPLTLTNIDVNIQEEGVEQFPSQPNVPPLSIYRQFPSQPNVPPLSISRQFPSQSNVPPLSISRQFPSQPNVPPLSIPRQFPSHPNVPPLSISRQFPSQPNVPPLSISRQFPSQPNVPPLSISRQFPSQPNVPLCSSITGVVPTIAIHNLSTFVLEEINVNALALKATFGVSVSRVTCDGTYDITGVVGNLIPAWGNGPFTAEITGLNVTNGLLQIGSSNGTLFLKNLTVDFTYDNIKLHFEGLVGGGSLGELVNQILDDLVPDLLVQFKPDILNYLSSTIKTYADNVLKTMTVSDLLKLINGGGAASLSARH